MEKNFGKFKKQKLSVSNQVLTKLKLIRIACRDGDILIIFREKKFNRVKIYAT
jgi:hypothetical protein